MEASNSKLSLTDLKLYIEAWCSTKEVCISEVKTKMRKWHISEYESDKLIAQMLESGFINEERYANAFTHDKLILDKWGPQKVRSALKLKGIKETIISKAISEQNVNQENILSEILVKKMKSFKQLAPREIYAKLMRFGLSRGFDYSLVAKYAEDLSGNLDEN
jgi:regulatory protein